MKRFLLLLALCILPVSLFAQDEDFQLNNGSLIWRRVYTFKVDTKAVTYNMKADGHFRNIEVMSDELVTAELVNLTLKINTNKYDRMKLPIYITNDRFSGMVTVEIKENRYRVTVSRIMADNPRLGKGPLDNLAIKDGRLASKFLGDPASIITSNFDDMFYSLARKINDDDEW